MYAVTPKCLAWLILWAGMIYVFAYIVMTEYSIHRVGTLLQ